MEENNIAKKLRSLTNLIMRYIDNSSNKKSVDKITGTNGWIIGYVAENSDGNIFQRDLEEEFGITRSTASRVVELMVRKNLIERKSVPQDARLKKLVLTPKAMEVYEMMEADKRRLEEQLVLGFSDDEIEQLSSFIFRMQQNMRK